MHEIICPHCNKAFKIDEAGYANILKQVRDGDFDKQLHERLELAEREKRDAIALAEAKLANALQSAAARKDTEIQALQAMPCNEQSSMWFSTSVFRAFMGAPAQRCQN